MKKIILVSGKKRSGKDFTTTEIIRQLTDNGITAKRVSFAAPMKQIIADTFGVTEEVLEECKNNPETFIVGILKQDQEAEIPTADVLHETNFRKILQNFGSGAMKKVFGDQIWANLALKQVGHELAYGADVVVLSDFRFDTEFHIFKAALGDAVVTINVLGGDLGDEHISEIGPSIAFDYTIDNTAKSPAIFKNIAEILQSIADES